VPESDYTGSCADGVTELKDCPRLAIISGL